MGSIRIIQGEGQIMGGYLSEGISLPDSYSLNATNCTLVAVSRRHITPLVMKHASVAGQPCGYDTRLCEPCSMSYQS